MQALRPILKSRLLPPETAAARHRYAVYAADMGWARVVQPMLDCNRSVAGEAARSDAKMLFEDPLRLRGDLRPVGIGCLGEGDEICRLEDAAHPGQAQKRSCEGVVADHPGGPRLRPTDVYAHSELEGVGVGRVADRYHGLIVP